MRALLLSAMLLMPLPAAAHPHVFIDTGLGFLFNDKGQLAAVRVVWVYDELYTLMLFEDLGLDPDGDLVLTPEELDRLAEADATWEPDYEGDLYGLADGAPIALAPPERFGLTLHKGRVVSTHVRPLAQPLDPARAAVSFKVYDPWYYAAMDLSLSVTAENRPGCAARIVKADTRAAGRKLQSMLNAIQNDAEFPKVGGDFADEVRVQCGSGF